MSLRLCLWDTNDFFPSGTQNCMLPAKSGLIVYLWLGLCSWATVIEGDRNCWEPGPQTPTSVMFTYLSTAFTGQEHSRLGQSLKPWRDFMNNMNNMDSKGTTRKYLLHSPLTMLLTHLLLLSFSIHSKRVCSVQWVQLKQFFVQLYRSNLHPKWCEYCLHMSLKLPLLSHPLRTCVHLAAAV